MAIFRVGEKVRINCPSRKHHGKIGTITRLYDWADTPVEAWSLKFDDGTEDSYFIRNIEKIEYQMKIGD